MVQDYWLLWLAYEPNNRSCLMLHICKERTILLYVINSLSTAEVNTEGNLSILTVLIVYRFTYFLIEASRLQSFSHEIQPPSSKIRPLEQQASLSEHQVPESTVHAAQKPYGKSVNEVEQPYKKDNGITFVLSFDSQDVIPSN
jgi:hypothetical protein